jgi:glycosyltransferase involved in cell wall biosynthesis
MQTEPVLLASIVVACRNERAHIASFLDSLLAQDLEEGTWEAIIADGESEDGTREIIQEYGRRFPAVRLVDNPGRFASSGLNAAIRAARGDVILRMDAHTVYAAAYCRRCIETLARTGAANVGGPARTRAVGTRARAVAAAYHSRFSTGGARFHDPDYEGWVDTLPYGCWRKATLVALGGFDESLVRNQDDELNLRTIRAGGHLWQTPEIESWYYPRSTLRQLFRQYFQYGFWKVAVIRKHRLPASWRHLVPVVFVAGQALLLAALAVTAIAGSREQFRAVCFVSLGALSAYATANLLASILTARRYGWATLPHLPAVFAAYHYSYGLGFAAGLRWLIAPPSGSAPESLFSSVTR